MLYQPSQLTTRLFHPLSIRTSLWFNPHCRRIFKNNSKRGRNRRPKRVTLKSKIRSLATPPSTTMQRTSTTTRLSTSKTMMQLTTTTTRLSTSKTTMQLTTTTTRTTSTTKTTIQRTTTTTMPMRTRQMTTTTTRPSTTTTTRQTITTRPMTCNRSRQATPTPPPTHAISKKLPTCPTSHRRRSSCVCASQHSASTRVSTLRYSTTTWPRLWSRCSSVSLRHLVRA